MLVLTPNPAIDRTMLVPGFRAAEVCRSVTTRDGAGGKGLNVVRVARTLGYPARAFGPLGGENGRRIAALAQAEGLPATWFQLRVAESRVCLLINDPDSFDTLTINEPGPHIPADEWDALLDAVRAACTHDDALVVAGSLPPATSVDRFCAVLVAVADARPVFLDTSGAALRAALDLPLALLKVNAHEIGAALDRVIDTPMQAIDAARRVMSRGPRVAMITLGHAGAVAVNAEGAWLAVPPTITPVSTVGSGDALLAGVTTALLRGYTLAAALRLGVAAGAANALVLGPGMLRREDVDWIEQATTLTEL